MTFRLPSSPSLRHSCCPLHWRAARSSTHAALVGLLPERLDGRLERLQVGDHGLVFLKQRLGRVLVLTVVLAAGDRLLLLDPSLGLVSVGQVLRIDGAGRVSRQPPPQADCSVQQTARHHLSQTATRHSTALVCDQNGSFSQKATSQNPIRTRSRRIETSVMKCREEATHETTE